MTQPMTREGQQLGNYRLIRLLGRGGFAEVYLAEHIHLQTQAAIKILATQLTDEDRVKFRHEARLVARLRHRNIIDVLDFGISGGIAYLVMLYAPNGTMRELYPTGSVLSLAETAKYISQAANGLRYAHEHGVIHRDVKPENMLIGPSEELMLSDFGIAIGPASASNPLQRSTQDVAGTAAYMAPEQLRGKPQAASDQYALAVVAYEWLCGKRPFTGSFAEVAGQHLNAPPRPLRTRNPHIPREVEAVVLKGLDKQPSRRYPHVSDFASALANALYLTTPLPEPPPLVRIPPRRSRPTDIGTGLSRPSTASTQPMETDKERAAGAPLDPSAPRAITPSIGRRMLLLGLGGLLTTAAITGALYWLDTHQPAYTAMPGHATPPPQHTPTPAKTPQANAGTPAVGTTLYTYNATTFVNSVAWSPRGTYVASGNDDGVIQTWNLTTHDLVHTYTGHTARVKAVVWSPDESMIASASDDGTVQVWTPVKGTLVYKYENHIGPVHSASWSPDGMSIASGGEDKTVQIWNPLNGTLIYAYRKHVNPIVTLAWSPNGHQIASTATVEDIVVVWDASNGSLISYHRHNSTAYAVAWSSDGAYIASGGNDKTIDVWPINNGVSILTYTNHKDIINTIAWSLDGVYIASGSDDNTAQIWKAYEGTHLFTYTGHSSFVDSISWSHLDGKRIASGGADKTVQIWQALE